MQFRKHPDRWIKHFISVPFIYSMVIPAIILDIFLEVYHRICFPLYGIAYVKRSSYIYLDRHKLSYLSVIEKINCTYCGYVNGLFGYAVAIGGETEKYWCGITHESRREKYQPDHHKDFLPYNDKNAFLNFVNTHSRHENRLADWLLLFVGVLIVAWILFKTVTT